MYPIIPLGACVAIAKAGYPPSGFSLDSFHLSKRQTGLTHGPQFRNSFDPCVANANEPRIYIFTWFTFSFVGGYISNLTRDIFPDVEWEKQWKCANCGKISKFISSIWNDFFDQIDFCYSAVILCSIWITRWFLYKKNIFRKSYGFVLTEPLFFAQKQIFRIFSQ